MTDKQKSDPEEANFHLFRVCFLQFDYHIGTHKSSKLVVIANYRVKNHCISTLFAADSDGAMADK